MEGSWGAGEILFHQFFFFFKTESLCVERTEWPTTHRDRPACHVSAGIKGVLQHTWLCPFLLNHQRKERVCGL